MMSLGPAYYHISLQALKPATTDSISTLLNPIKIIPTDEGLPRDWRGLAQLAGLHGAMLPLIGSKANPTKELLGVWTSSLGQLQTYLGQLDRWDIVDDTADMIEQDAKEYVKRQENAQICASPVNVEVDNQILTVDDVFRLEQGLEPQNYDSFLLYADEDVNFATEIIDTMESKYGLKLCIRDRDLVGGLTFQHEAIMKLIAKRCNRLIVVVSPSFLRSEANKFFVTYAQALGIDQRQRKVVPILYERCQLPPDLNYYFLLDYTRSGRLWDFWSKLRDSIQTPTGRSDVSNLGIKTDNTVDTCISKSKEVKDDLKSISQEKKSLDTSMNSVIEPLGSIPDSKPGGIDITTPKKLQSTTKENSKPMSAKWLQKLLPHQSKKKKLLAEDS